MSHGGLPEMIDILDRTQLPCGQSIAVRLRYPQRRTHGLAVLVHGFSSSMDSSTNTALTESLLPAGLAVLCLDLRGHGGSDGRIEDLTISSAVEDLQAAVQWALRSRPFLAEVPLVVTGSSFGGAVSLAGAEAIGACGIVLKAPVSDLVAMQREALGESGLREWRATGFGSVPGRGGMIPVRYSLVDDGMRYDLPGLARDAGLPIRIVHGRRDEVVPCRHSERLCGVVGERAHLMIIESGDHRFSDEADFRQTTDYLRARILELLGL